MTNTHRYSPTTNYPGHYWFAKCKTLTPSVVCSNKNQYTYYDRKSAANRPSILDYTFSNPQLRTHIKNWSYHNTQSTDWNSDHYYITYKIALQWIYSHPIIPPHWN